MDNFSSTPPHVWASEGGKRAALHYDAVDNLHVVISGEKEVTLVAPSDLVHFYFDFLSPTADEQEEHKEAKKENKVCPSDTGRRFGCDGFACFGYSPVDTFHVELSRFPRVAEATVYGPVRLRPGDMLFIPPFWAHRVVHHPLEGGGRNIALSFVRRSAGLRRDQRPFVADLADTQRLWARPQAGGSSD